MNTLTTCAEKKAKQFLNLLQGYTKGIRITAILILLLMGVSNAWAGATWIGKSFIVANGTWYNASGTGQTAGAFHNKNLGSITSLTLGGEIQTYGQSDGAKNPAKMHYQISGKNAAYITLYWFKYQDNNNFFHSNSNGSTSSNNTFASKTIDISSLTPGDYTLSVWFEQPDGGQWDSNNSNNYVASFTIDPVVTFKANGGTGSDYTQIVKYNTSTALNANTFTRTGYTFAGWNTKTDGTGTSYTDKQKVTLKANTTLYAQWTEKTYSLTFKHDGNGTIQVGGATVSSGSNASVNHFTAKTLVATPNTGYNFSSWTLSGSNTGAVTIGSTTTASTTIKATNTGATVTANFTPKTYNITYTAPTNGSYTIKVGNNEAVSANTTADYNTTITLTNTPDPGYHFSKWTITPAVSITDNKTFLMPASDVKIDATFEADTYTITWNANGGSVSPESSSYTYNGDPIVLPQPTRDGYTFLGWFTSANGGDKIKDVGKDNKPTSDVEYFAQWTAKQYTVKFDQQDATTTGTLSTTVTYDQAMPVITLPTKNGYGFAGYFDDLDGNGKQYYYADGTSARTWDKDIDNTTLYAFFKKAEITSITLDKTLFGSGETGYVTVTNHTIEPKPAGTVVVCWTLCYNNGTPVEGHNAIKENGTVKFAIDGLSAGTYKIVASLRLNDCNGEELDTAEATFLVAGSYTVTIKYTCDGQEIAGRTTIEGHPSRQTKVTAAEIGGYNFVKWELGDGISTTDALTDKTINITASYEGYLTATYEKKKLIFLDLSTLKTKANWTAPHIYLYKGAKDDKNGGYWNDQTGAGGATGGNYIKHAAMTQVPNTEDIWYYEYEEYANDFKAFVAFTSNNQSNSEHFANCEVIYRADFTSGTPVFVPESDQTAETKNSTAKYYSKGYWVKYMDGTGYWLIIYNEAGDKELVRREFTSETQRMTMTSIVDLEAEHTYKYEIYRNDGYYYNGGDITYTNKDYKPLNEANKHSIKTTETGNYTFTLDYFTGDLQIKVQYPGEVGDYLILYKDDTRTTYKPSDIKKADELNPVTSFFVRPDKHPELIVQTAARVSNEGVTWYADNHIYFKPNANWKQNDAYFAARFNGTEEVWSVLNQNGDVYSCKIPNGANDVIFVRMNPNGSDATNNKLNWNNKWNQTGHLSLPKDKNEYTLNEGEWGNKLYLKPNSNWTQGDAWFAAYFFETGKEEKWLGMSDEDGDGVYVCDIPAENHKKVTFVRMNKDKHELSWGSKWDQSTDQTVPTNGNTLFTVKDGDWNNASGSWSEREGSWSTINGSITDLSVQLKNKLAELDLEDIKETEGSVFNIHLSNNEGTLTIEKVAFYTGNFYIRVDAADGKWYDYKTNPDNLMTYSAFSESDANSFGKKFSHYKTKWCPRGTNVKFVIANDYSLCISDTLARDLVRASGVDYMTEGGELYQEDGGTKDPVYDRYSANIRFMWNRKTNEISRAYLASSSNDSRQFLVLKGCQEIKDENGNNLSGNGDNHGEHRALLQDTQDWIYERTFMVQPGTRVKLYACYADTTVSPATAQYFRGKHDGGNCGSTENSVQILGGNGEDWEKIRVIYDFKTNRLMGAWVPSGDITGGQAINADLMIIREHQENATCVTLTNENSKLTDVKTAYGAMQFNRWTINNRGGADDHDITNSTVEGAGGHRVYDENITNLHHPVLSLAEQKSIYERGLYFISFPFDVHLSDVFGFGTYGTHWVISTYNGKRRAERGYFAEDCINEDCTNWDYIWDPSGFVMKANEGYLLSLDLDLMKHDNTSFWANNISQVELFFPSTAAVESIEKTDYTMPALTDEYLCKINHNTPDGDRRVKDSYWRCIGVPSFADYDGSLTTDGENTINWKDDYTWEADKEVFPFLYEWNVTNNDLVVRSTNSYKFRATYAYLIQNGNEIHWSAVNTKKPTSIIARDQTENVSNFEWKIALLRNDAPADHTFIRMTDNESVTSAFDFHQDLSKEFNYGANIYTLVGYERLAANSLPMSDSTTIIPLGVSAQEAGDYTITMPEGVENIGITLVDNETGIHTNLSAGQEYTLTLNNGICENRLFIEVSPIQNTPTDLEYTTEDTREQTTRKMLIDGMLYLIRDGVIYDAQGHKL